MIGKYNQKPVVTGTTQFTRSPMSEVEYSRMTANPVWALPFNAGDIVPVYFSEVLPHDTFSVDLNFVIRQMTALHPTMGDMYVDFYAYFVPNRIVNESWKNVQGENTSGYWSAPDVSLAPLYTGTQDVQIPVGSIADYYGFPTQGKIKAEHLQRCNDLKFRGYLEIYNNYFRDENYQPPIPYSKLNVYNGFLDENIILGLEGPASTSRGDIVPANSVADGSYPNGAIVKAIAGNGGEFKNESTIAPRLTTYSFLDKPLKANKLHDFITSALPSPQKGSEVFFGIGDLAPLTTDGMYDISDIKYRFNQGAYTPTAGQYYTLTGTRATEASEDKVTIDLRGLPVIPGTGDESFVDVDGWNVYADISKTTGISVNDLRTAVATQQVYEQLARGGSRYVEVLRSFFEIETENPFLDIPTELGHIRRTLDMYQVAQTSASTQGGTPQGELSAFGYTSNAGHLFTRTFLEHGYIHIFAVVRHRNIYSTYFAPDNFRMSTLDFYLPQLANIGEQPISIATLNPFFAETDRTIGYQEAWWDYRFEPDRVHGLFRTGVDGSLAVWNYADNYQANFDVVDGEWLKSNSEEVLNRTIAVTSKLAPQFKGLFSWKIDKQRPLPTYSIPGLDIL